MTGNPNMGVRDILNNPTFFLDEEHYDEFVAMLEAEPEPMPRLQALLNEPTIWD